MGNVVLSFSNLILNKTACLDVQCPIKTTVEKDKCDRHHLKQFD